MTYQKDQIDEVRGEYLKIKITSDDGETKWMDISKVQLKKIRSILN